MARDFRWYTTVSGHTNKSDEVVELYSGPGTVWRVVGHIVGACAPSSTSALQLYTYVVNVGPAAADGLANGEDGDDVLLHGGGIATRPTSTTWISGTPVAALETEGRRIIPSGGSLWLRIQGRAPTGGWTWYYQVRALILLPPV